MRYAFTQVSPIDGITAEVTNSSTIHCFGDPSMRVYTTKPETITGVTVTQSSRSSDNYILNVNSENGEEYILWNKTNGEVYKCNSALEDVVSTTPFDDFTLCITGNNRIPFVANIGELLKNRNGLSGSITSARYYNSLSSVLVDYEVDQSKNGRPINKVSLNVHDLAGNLLGSSVALANTSRTAVSVKGAKGILVVSLLVNDVVVDSKCITSN